MFYLLKNSIFPGQYTYRSSDEKSLRKVQLIYPTWCAVQKQEDWKLLAYLK